MLPPAGVNLMAFDEQIPGDLLDTIGVTGDGTC